jgi:RimJ/RimL family protein N-acetyltransferase
MTVPGATLSSLMTASDGWSTPPIELLRAHPTPGEKGCQGEDTNPARHLATQDLRWHAGLRKFSELVLVSGPVGTHRPRMILEPLSLRGDHVSLEPLLPEHAPELLAAANESRRTYAFTTVPADRDGMQAYVELAMTERDKGISLPFAVRDRSGALVGTTRYLAIEWWRTPADQHLAEVGPSAVEIGATWYAERVQRTALNTEAKLLLCTHAFETWKVYRISWKTDSRNERSKAAILRLGASLDGCLRAHRLGADGVVRDTVFFSMMSSEWPKAKRKLDARLGRTQPSAVAG